MPDTYFADELVNGGQANLLSNWNRAKARVRANVVDATVAFVGDSTTVGHGAGDDPINNFNNARPRSMPSRAAQQLTLMGLPVSADGTFGGNTIDSASATVTKLQLYDTRIAIASSGTTQWYFRNEYSVGGRILAGQGVGAVYAITPALAFDTIDVFYARGNGAGGTLTVDKDGGAALATINYTSSNALTKQTITVGGAPALGTINTKLIAVTGAARLIGILPRSTVTRRVNVLNLGWEGAQTGDWASTAGAYAPVSALDYNPGNALALINPDLTVIKLGANDLAASVPVATSRANLVLLIAKAQQGGGSVILVTPTPQNPATRDPANLTTAYNAMLRELAASTGCGFIDLHSRYMSWASANGFGYFADDVHSLPIGYANEGDVLARVLFDS